MNEFAGDPHVGDGFEEISPLRKALPNFRSRNTLIKPCQRVCGFCFGISIGQMSLVC